MRKAASIIALTVFVFAASLRADDKKTLTVTAVTHDSRVNERTSYHTKPGQSTTDCTGTGTDSTIHVDCESTTTPPTTSSITTRTTDVSEEVRGSDNVVYTIACTDRPNILAAAIVGAAAGGGASGDSTLAGSGKCKPLIDGAHFDAEIKGTTMWVHARKEGRKVIKIKYKILNIRQYIPTQTPPANVGNAVRKQMPPATASNDECRGDERDTNEVWRLGRSLGEKDNEIADAVKSLGACRVLAYLRGEADARPQESKSAIPSSPPPSVPPALSNKTDSYSGVGGGHWISEVSSNGAIVTLEDGSLWEVSTVDRVYTFLWLIATNITVLKSQSVVGDYTYTLINKDDGEKALAKYLGKE